MKQSKQACEDIKAHQACDVLRAKPGRGQPPAVPPLLDLRQVGTQYEQNLLQATSHC